MFSDTHCHLNRMQERGVDISVLLHTLSAEKFPFVFDIGTRPGDFAGRVALARAACVPSGAASGTLCPDSEALPPFLHFSCGLWPDAETIAARDESLRALEADAASMLALAARRAGSASAPDSASPGKPLFAAIGECGLDRWWNGPAAAQRMAQGTQSSAADDGPGTTDTDGEEALFAAQIELAGRLGLPFIVHSREAFAPTYSVIRSCGWFRGVIHCFSYGEREAAKFLDLGFFLSFPGNITFGKKAADRERISGLLRYVPRDRLLLETDAPYLAPAPERGTVNTPQKIRYIYAAAAGFLGIPEEELAALVLRNAVSAFSLQTPG